MKKVICVDRDKKQHEVSADDLKFRPAVYGIIFKDDRILLSKQWDGYDFPGGGIKIGEHIKDALTREIKEETGLEAEISALVSCEDSFYKTLKGRLLHSILIYYICKVTGGELSIDYVDEHEKEYISMPQWIPIEDIEKIKFYNSIDSVEIIKKALKIRNK